MKDRKKILFASIFLFLILIVSLFYHSQNKCSPKKSFLQAADYFNNWQLKKAEKLLASSFTGSQVNTKAANLYLQILIYEGELHTAQKFIWKYFSNTDFQMPRINLKKGQIYYYLGKIDSSKIAAETALVTGLRIKNAAIISQANNILGRIMFYKAKYDSAKIYQNAALKYASTHNLKNEKANALRQLGVLYWYKGKLDSAMNDFYKPALELYRRVNNKVGEATTLSNIGLLYYNWKNWYQNFAYNINAFSIRKTIGDKIGLCDSYYFLSDLPRFNKTMTSTHIKLLRLSYGLSKKIGYAWGKEVAGRSLEFFWTDNLGGGTAAINPDSILRDSVNYASGEGKMFLLLRKIFVFTNNNNTDSLCSTYKSIINFADSLNYEIFKFSSLCGYANILINQNNLLEAEKVLNNVKLLTHSSKKRKYDYHYLNRLFAKLYLRKGKLLKASKILQQLTAYYDSLYINKLNNNPSILGYESAISETYSFRSSSYELLLDVLFKLKKYNSFFTTVEAEKRLSLWETPKDIINITGYSHTNFANLLLNYISSKNTKKREKYLLNEFDILIKNKIKQQKKILVLSKAVTLTPSINLQTLQKSLDSSSLFLEYAFGNNSLYCLTISHDQIFINSLLVNNKNLNKHILFFRDAIARGKWQPTDKLWQAPSLNLYKQLIFPLEKSTPIETYKQIIISPTRSLNLLPFSALLKSLNNNKLNYLIQHHTLNITNSASEYYCSKPRSNSNTNSLLAIAPSTSKLSYSQNEISEIPQSLFIQKKILRDKEATLNNFLQNFQNYDVIHFAGHASINNVNPFYSKLKFYNGDLELFQILRYRIPAKLIILSACESGIGMGTVTDLPTDVDFVSFPRAWITAGAKSVISTQWLVEDKSASLLMKYFYNNLSKNKTNTNFTFATALNNAQLRFLKTSKKQHPFYWAEFYLTK